MLNSLEEVLDLKFGRALILQITPCTPMRGTVVRFTYESNKIIKSNKNFKIQNYTFNFERRIFSWSASLGG